MAAFKGDPATGIGPTTCSATVSPTVTYSRTRRPRPSSEVSALETEAELATWAADLEVPWFVAALVLIGRDGAAGLPVVVLALSSFPPRFLRTINTLPTVEIRRDIGYKGGQGAILRLETFLEDNRVEKVRVA